MKTFSGIYEDYKNDLLRNKIENDLNLNISIKCHFCNYIDEFECKNDVADKEERWLASETFIQDGWNMLITPEDKGIACPTCISKWKNGDWYLKENMDEEWDEEGNELPLH